MVALSHPHPSFSSSQSGGGRVAARVSRNSIEAAGRSPRPASDNSNVSGERLQLRESPLQAVQKPPVEQAAVWANEMVLRETRGPGDLPNAMQRLERRYSLPAKTLWSLRYRRPKDIFASLYFKLSEAYQAECERQMRRLSHEIEITRAIAGSAHPAVASAAALVGQTKK